MGQEFFINSQDLEAKIRQLLPSQGGAGAGFDLSASTQIIPVVDLTESAEGSNLRADLQTAFNFNSTPFDVHNVTNTVLLNSTGFYKFYGNMSGAIATSPNACELNIFDGTTSKRLFTNGVAAFQSSVGASPTLPFEFVVKLEAGQSIRGTATAFTRILGIFRQIADIDGNLN